MGWRAFPFLPSRALSEGGEPKRSYSSGWKGLFGLARRFSRRFSEWIGERTGLA